MVLECTAFHYVSQSYLPKEPVYGRISCGTGVPVEDTLGNAGEGMTRSGCLPSFAVF